MAKIAPIQPAIVEKFGHITLTEEKTTQKGRKALFVIVPVVVATIATVSFFVARRFRNKSAF